MLLPQQHLLSELRVSAHSLGSTVALLFPNGPSPTPAKLPQEGGSFAASGSAARATLLASLCLD